MLMTTCCCIKSEIASCGTYSISKKQIMRCSTNFLLILFHIPCLFSAQASADNQGRDFKIVNGDVAPNSEFQYQVSVQSTLDSYHLCSGVVFNEDYILTTAVCCTQDDPFLLKVVAGRHDLTNTEAGMEVELTTVFPHDDFDSFNLYNNICIMKLASPLSLEESNIQSAPLPLQGQNFSGDATVSGWGTTSPEDTEGSDVLLYAIVPIVSDSDCLDIMGSTLQPLSMICAGGGDADACDRDQGGPLTCANQDNSDVVCGLVSFGLGRCATPGFPGVYTEVSAYATWIENTVNEGDATTESFRRSRF